MANTLDTFMSQVASRFTETTAFALKGQYAYLSAILHNPTPETMPPNQKVTVQASLSLSGVGVDAYTSAPSTKNIVTVGTELTLDELYALPFQMTEAEMLKIIDQPNLFAKVLETVSLDVLSYANGKVAANFTTTNFDVSGNTSRTATPTAGAEMTVEEIGALRTAMVIRGVPQNDIGNLFVITHPIIYGKWLTDDDFAKASTLGDEWASTLRSNGDLRPQWNFLPLEDTQSNVTGTTPEFTYTTTMFHRAAQIMVTAPLPPPVDGTKSVTIPIPLGTPGAYIPVRITAQHKQGIGATGGSYTQFLAEAAMGFHVHRKQLGIIHSTVLDAG